MNKPYLVFGGISQGRIIQQISMIERRKIKLVNAYSGGFQEAQLIHNMLLDNDIKTTLENGYMASIAPWIISPGGVNPVNVIVDESDLNLALKLIEEFNTSNKII